MFTLTRNLFNKCHASLKADDHQFFRSNCAQSENQRVALSAVKFARGFLLRRTWPFAYDFSKNHPRVPVRYISGVAYCVSRYRIRWYRVTLQRPGYRRWFLKRPSSCLFKTPRISPLSAGYPNYVGAEFAISRARSADLHNGDHLVRPRGQTRIPSSLGHVHHYAAQFNFELLHVINYFSLRHNVQRPKFDH